MANKNTTPTPARGPQCPGCGASVGSQGQSCYDCQRNREDVDTANRNRQITEQR